MALFLRPYRLIFEGGGAPSCGRSSQLVDRAVPRQSGNRYPPETCVLHADLACGKVEFKNQCVPGTMGMVERPLEYLPKEQVEKLVKDAFTSATERHIEVGDGLQIVTVSASDGYREEVIDLKRD